MIILSIMRAPELLLPPQSPAPVAELLKRLPT